MIAVSSENHQRFIKLDRSRQDELRSEIIGRRFLAPTGFTAAEIQASQSTIHNPHSEIRISFAGLRPMAGNRKGFDRASRKENHD